jgi:hypothetical protein
MDINSYIQTILKDERPVELSTQAPFIPFPEKNDEVVSVPIGKDSTINIFMPQKTKEIEKYFYTETKLKRDIKSMVIALLHLLKDYQNLCSSIFDLNAMENIILSNTQNIDKLRQYVPIYDIDEQKLLIPSTLNSSSLQSCLNQTDVVVIPLLFMKGSSESIDKIKALSGIYSKFIMDDLFSSSGTRSLLGELVHVGLLIFFPKEKKATYIDPNGAMSERSEYPNLEIKLKNFFEKIGYEYEQAELYCPRYGSLNLVYREIQKTTVVKEVPILKDGGFCLIWTFAMILHIALNPKMKTLTIFQRLNALLSGRLIPYTLFLLNYFEKYISIL